MAGSAKKEETLLQNYLQTYLNSISFATRLISYYLSLSFHYLSLSFAIPHYLFLSFRLIWFILFISLIPLIPLILVNWVLAIFADVANFG